jgi:hypothetical protein
MPVWQAQLARLQPVVAFGHTAAIRLQLQRCTPDTAQHTLWMQASLHRQAGESQRADTTQHQHQQQYRPAGPWWDSSRSRRR